MFEDRQDWPKGWHLLNDASGQQGEFTLCGIAFDGDATMRFTKRQYLAEYMSEGKVTYKDCIAIIKMCKAVKL